MESMEEKNGKACVAEEWKREYAEESILKAEEKRWSRRWRDALSWFISNGNKLGISPPCLFNMRICRASHSWQLPINKSMAGSAGSHSSSIWKYMMMALHSVIF